MGEPNHTIRWSKVLSFVLFSFLVVPKTLFALWLLLSSVLMLPGVIYHNPKIAFLVKVNSKPVIFFLKLGLLFTVCAIYYSTLNFICLLTQSRSVSWGLSRILCSPLLSFLLWITFYHQQILPPYYSVHSCDMTDMLNIRDLDAENCEMTLEITIHWENYPILCFLPVDQLFYLFSFLCKGSINIFRAYSKGLGWESFGSVKVSTGSAHVKTWWLLTKAPGL